jgi:hypothetical protein
MVLKSFPRRRKCLAAIVASLCLASAHGFAEPIFFPVESTPYDNQMARVQPVLVSICGAPADAVSLTTINQWVDALRRLPYRYSKQWQTPFEVNMTRAGDCKGKALALYEVMQSMGVTDVRLVIGRHRAGDWFTHAWLEWETVEGTYVLDPTFNWHAIRAERNSAKYVPLYAYEGAQRYRAINANLVSEIPPRAVALGR